MIVIKITAQTDMTRSANFIRGLRVSPVGAEPARHKDEEAVKRENENRDVCLNCTKEKCTGTAACFRKERDRKK